MKKFSNSNNTKIYCEKCDLILNSREKFLKHLETHKCDLILNSREKFLKHLETHSSTIPCDVCPIDTVIDKFVNLFKKKSSHNLE